MECIVNISSKVNTTEDAEKVEKSIQNIFPDGEIMKDSHNIFLSGNKNLLNDFKKNLKKRKIRSVARSIMDTHIKNNTITFYLNKQAAFVNVINFCEDNFSPLGNIKVEIESDDVESVLNWLAPIEEIETN